MESSAAWSELCAELGQLPDDELELFEDEIRKPEHARRMACAPAPLRRIEVYWRAAAQRLGAAHPSRRREQAVRPGHPRHFWPPPLGIGGRRCHPVRLR